ncbi:unnamed protein product, partial [Didymodactylos carnosus]
GDNGVIALIAEQNKELIEKYDKLLKHLADLNLNSYDDLDKHDQQKIVSLAEKTEAMSGMTDVNSIGLFGLTAV